MNGLVLCYEADKYPDRWKSGCCFLYLRGGPVWSRFTPISVNIGSCGTVHSISSPTKSPPTGVCPANQPEIDRVRFYVGVPVFTIIEFYCILMDESSCHNSITGPRQSGVRVKWPATGGFSGTVNELVAVIGPELGSEYLLWVIVEVIPERGFLSPATSG